MSKKLALVMVFLMLFMVAVTPAFAGQYDLKGRIIRVAGHEADGMRAYFENGEGRGR